jgi:hypothetical protein
MITPPPAGLRRLAVVLALSALPMFAFAGSTPGPDAFSGSTAHPWKLAYARRIANEGMESREERVELAKRALREWKRKQAALRAGRRARPATPDGSTPRDVDATPLRRLPRRLGTTTFTPPANTLVNDPSADSPVSGQSETSVAAFGDIVVAAWNDGQGFVGPTSDEQGWATSSDGGLTWTDRGNPPHPPGVSNFEWFSDPLVAVNEKTGAFYFAALCDFSSAQGSRAGIGVIKGRWDGTTIAWGTPVIVHEGPFLLSELSDKEWLVADSLSGRVYLTYTQFLSGLSRIMLQSADSNAVTFSSPQQVSLNTSIENGFVQGSRPVVDGNGRLYVVYELIGQSFADYFRIRRSDNQGLSFALPVTAESLYTNFGTGPPGFNRPTGIDFCGITVDRSHGPHRGRIYLSWAESINWLDEVFTLGLAGNKTEVESNATPATATPAAIGQTLRGTVNTFSDVDLFSVTLAQGQHIVIAADSAQTSSSESFNLRLLAGDGVTVLTFTTFDSNVNPAPGQPQGFPSGWMFTAPTSGTYYIRVGTSNSVGSYRIRTGIVHRDQERGRDQRDVFVGYSDDGLTWSAPVRLNEDDAGFDEFTPEISAAPDGGVYCTWYDYRDSAPAKDGGEASVYLARSGDGGLTWTTLGPLTDTLTDWSATGTNIVPNQGDYMTLFSSATYVWSVWSDGRRGNPDVFSARTPLIPNGAQVAFQNVHLADALITIDWLTTPPDTLTMRLYRGTDTGPFTFVDVVQFDAGGQLSYADTTVIAEHTYTYRLGRFSNGVELFYGQVSVFLPGSFPLRMSPPRPNPIVGGTFVADFSLATNEPADLILFDITGREVMRRRVALGKGPHTVSLPVPNGLNQGLYVLTLRQGGHNASTRAFLVR